MIMKRLMLGILLLSSFFSFELDAQINVFLDCTDGELLNVNLPLLGILYPAPLQVVRRRIGILRFELGMMNAFHVILFNGVR